MLVLLFCGIATIGFAVTCWQQIESWLLARQMLKIALRDRQNNAVGFFEGAVKAHALCAWVCFVGTIDFFWKFGAAAAAL